MQTPGNFLRFRTLYSVYIADA